MMCVYETGDELDNRLLARKKRKRERERKRKRKRREKYIGDRLAIVARFVQLLLFSCFFLALEYIETGQTRKTDRQTNRQTDRQKEMCWYCTCQ
jgi:hypothetical protein